MTKILFVCHGNICRSPMAEGIDRIANLLGTGSCGFDAEFRLQTCFLHQIFHHELGHWAAADVAVAHKQDLCHWLESIVPAKRPAS